MRWRKENQVVAAGPKTAVRGKNVSGRLNEVGVGDGEFSIRLFEVLDVIVGRMLGSEHTSTIQRHATRAAKVMSRYSLNRVLCQCIASRKEYLSSSQRPKIQPEIKPNQSTQTGSEWTSSRP